MLSYVGFSQNTYPESIEKVFENQNEIRLGALGLLSGTSLNFGYERILDRDRGYGADIEK